MKVEGWQMVAAVPAIMAVYLLFLIFVPRLRKNWRWGRRKNLRWGRRSNGAPVSNYGAFSSLVFLTTVFLTIVVPKLQPKAIAWPFIACAIAFANLIFASYMDNRREETLK